MLEVEFHYKTPAGNPNVIYTERFTYTVVKDGSTKPLLKNVAFTTLEGSMASRPQWASCQFPIAHYPNDLRLSVGKYYVSLDINGVAVDSASFNVDKPLIAYADLKGK